jgi:L-asparaginase
MGQTEDVRARKVVVLGTGGTIAGRAASAEDNIGYTAAQVRVDDLIAGIDAPSDVQLVAEQVAQLDSKDMGFDIWRTLAMRCAHWAAQADVVGIVVTHGTDTLEETAFFLHAVLAHSTPVVLTCAMRPATALCPDGPQNMRDAIVVASTRGAQGVSVVCAGSIHGAVDVHKVHTYRLDAFGSGDVGALGYVEEGRVRLTRPWPTVDGSGVDALAKMPPSGAAWPRIEIVFSHAGARGTAVDALVAARCVDGLVVAATGNGTIHADLEAALLRAQGSGIAVRRATRCPNGRILPKPNEAISDAGGLSPVKARIALLLELLGR